MAATITRGIRIAWGVVDPKPIHGLPFGKVRLRMRNKDVVRGFVKTPHGAKHFAVRDCGEHWEPIWQGENITVGNV